MEFRESKKECELSVVVPVFNEESGLNHFFNELLPMLERETSQFEIVFVNDGSYDNSLELIRELARKDHRIIGVELSRNFGHQKALLCGIRQACGRVVITLDADLQHPPELIPQMIREWEEGADVVQMVRKNSASENFFDKHLSSCFYRAFNIVSNVKLIPACPDFRLLDRSCVDALGEYKENNLFLRAVIPQMGFKQVYLNFNCPERKTGTRSYSIVKSLRMALDAFFSHSNLGLYVPFFIGAACFIALILSFLFFFYLYCTSAFRVKFGLAAFAIMEILQAGVVLMSLGIFGWYIARIFEAAKARPSFHVRSVISFSPGMESVPRKLKK
jgi:glycosyltransferase involved in cell wall biosynthesis